MYFTYQWIYVRVPVSVLRNVYTHVIHQNDLSWRLFAVTHVAGLCITMKGPRPSKNSLGEGSTSPAPRQGRAPVPQPVLRERCPV